MFTKYKHIKQYSQTLIQTPFTLECEVCQRIYPPLSVRSHLRTKKHQKNAHGRDLEPLAFGGQGAHLLAQEESGRAGRPVADEHRAEVRGTAGATARPVVAARGSG